MIKKLTCWMRDFLFREKGWTETILSGKGTSFFGERESDMLYREQNVMKNIQVSEPKIMNYYLCKLDSHYFIIFKSKVFN